MSSQLFTSVMQQSSDLLRNLIKLSQCSRRKQTPGPSAKLAVTARNKKDYDSDDTLASTEPGDMSNNEFSDKSYMTDGSSRRAPKTSVRLVNQSIVRLPPGLTAPPGLTRPTRVPAWKRPDTQLNADAQRFVPSMATMQSTLNPESPCFVPSLGAVASVVEQNLAQGTEAPQNSQQLRQSIKMLKGALEDWESNLPAPSLEEAPPLGPTDNLTVLQEALTKLSPEQANMVRTFLDQKVAADAVQQGGQKGRFDSLARTHPAGMQRSFVPFGGAHAPQDQVNRAYAPKKFPSRTTCQNSSSSEESLKDHLRVLSELDTCARVLMVRRINRLGLDSPALLKDYFKKFGNIEQVLVAHTRCKVKGAHSTTTRVRPAPLGFVIMSSPEEANAALAYGTEHAVQPGVEIGAYPFESHTVAE